MPLTCFVIFNAPERERAFVYRLQALATASGVRLLLPHRVGRHISNETRRRLDASDLVLVFMTSHGALQLGQELAYALAKGKPVVAIHRKGIRPLPVKGVEWTEYDPGKGTAAAEKATLRVLREHRAHKDNQLAIAVAVLGLALLALVSQSAKQR